MAGCRVGGMSAEKMTRCRRRLSQSRDIRLSAQVGTLVLADARANGRIRRVLSPLARARARPGPATLWAPSGSMRSRMCGRAWTRRSLTGCRPARQAVLKRCSSAPLPGAPWIRQGDATPVRMRNSRSRIPIGSGSRSLAAEAVGVVSVAGWTAAAVTVIGAVRLSGWPLGSRPRPSIVCAPTTVAIGMVTVTENHRCHRSHRLRQE